MNTHTEFDLKTFQDKVYKQYKPLMREVERADLISKRGYAGFEDKPDSSLIKKTFNKISRSLQRFLSAYYFKSSYFIDCEKKAVRIIDNTKIKKILCPILKKIPQNLFKEELAIEVIKILTTSLTKELVVEEFFIEKDSQLFSMMTYKIIQKGINNYC